MKSLHSLSRSKVLPALGILLAAPIAAMADEADVVRFSEIAKKHKKVVVPIPSEIFNVLDKFDVARNDWRDELKVPERGTCRDRNQYALFLGRVVAEGFLAVEAQDREAIRSIGRTVLSVAEELGLRSAVIKHTKAIIDEANDGDWSAVREEFDATRQTVRDEMEKRRDQDLAQCVSVGGWIRGTEIITALINRDYSAKKSEILHQPQLLDHFTTTFKEVRSFQKSPRMKKIIAGLDKLQPLMTDEGVISKQRVADIQSISAQLRKETLTP
ncbi:MAG: hypothetical protein GWQ05_27655 [Verrucomicrobiaceae bacterium]|nr:hypothetical protein [Verrucomicrobiaceae bacterium]